MKVSRFSARVVALIALCMISRPAIAQHRLLLSDQLEKKVLILEKDGHVTWEYAEPGQVYDGEQLANGNVLYCWFSGGKNSSAGVKEVTPDKRIVFQYPIAQECHSVRRLPRGLTLIEDPTNRRLIEVNNPRFFAGTFRSISICRRRRYTGGIVVSPLQRPSPPRPAGRGQSSDDFSLPSAQANDAKLQADDGKAVTRQVRWDAKTPFPVDIQF